MTCDLIAASVAAPLARLSLAFLVGVIALSQAASAAVIIDGKGLRRRSSRLPLWAPVSSKGRRQLHSTARFCGRGVRAWVRQPYGIPVLSRLILMGLFALATRHSRQSSNAHRHS